MMLVGQIAAGIILAAVLVSLAYCWFGMLLSDEPEATPVAWFLGMLIVGIVAAVVHFA